MTDSIDARTDRQAARQRLQGYWAAFAAVLLWAGFVLVSRLGGRSVLTPWDILALRLVAAALVLLPVSLRFPAGTWVDPRMWALVLAGGVASPLLAYAGFKFAPAAHGAILFSGLQPFVVAVVAWLILGNRPSRARLLALVPVGGGVLCLALPLAAGLHGGSAVLAGDGLVAASGVAWACYSVLSRRWNVDPWLLTRFVVLGTALVYLPVYLLLLPKGIGEAPVGFMLLQALYQGIGASILAMALFLVAVVRIGPERTGVLTALVPVLAGLGAVPLLGEPLTGWLIAGLVLVSLGALMATREPLRR